MDESEESVIYTRIWDQKQSRKRSKEYSGFLTRKGTLALPVMAALDEKVEEEVRELARDIIRLGSGNDQGQWQVRTPLASSGGARPHSRALHALACRGRPRDGRIAGCACLRVSNLSFLAPRPARALPSSTPGHVGVPLGTFFVVT